jgi:hypothetical protein
MPTEINLDELDNVPVYKPALSPSQELIMNVALGMEDPEVLAARYGIEGEEWEKLKEYKPFWMAVERQKAELEASGLTFKIKAKALTEDVFEEAYKIARGHDATLMQKLEFIKLGAKLADMEPRANTQVASGPGFSISINFSTPKPDMSKKDDFIDITPEHVQITEKNEPNDESS